MFISYDGNNEITSLVYIFSFSFFLVEVWVVQWISSKEMNAANRVQMQIKAVFTWLRIIFPLAMDKY